MRSRLLVNYLQPICPTLTCNQQIVVWLKLFQDFMIMAENLRHPDGTDGIVKKQSQLKKKILYIIAIIAALALLWVGFEWLTNWRFIEKTDDAYIAGDIASISPRVSSYILEIPVHENQAVKKGDVLMCLEDGDFKIAVKQAISKLETQKSTLARINAQIAAAQTSFAEAKASRDVALAVQKNAHENLKRSRQLNAHKYLSQSQLDTANSSFAQAAANVNKAAAQFEAIKANINVLTAQLKEAETMTKSLELAKEKAERDLSFTILRAPFDGIIGNLGAKKGDFIVNGQRVASLVPIKHLYIKANFKETQLTNLHPGQKASITIDALDSEPFTGRLISISPASGSVFSLLPPQNATGNFTKVVQRFPIKISLPPESLQDGRIRAGMSVVVSVDTRSGDKETLNSTPNKT